MLIVYNVLTTDLDQNEHKDAQKNHKEMQTGHKEISRSNHKLQ